MGAAVAGTTSATPFRPPRSYTTIWDATLHRVRARWDDCQPEFWKNVRQVGRLPRTCMLCGGELPQWQVGEPDDPA
jgi:hypothetical protein